MMNVNMKPTSEQNSATAPKPAIFDQEYMRDLLQVQRKYRRKQRWEKFWELNPLAWFFDEFPDQEMYRPSFNECRSTRQQVRYYWLRRHTGWASLAQLKTTTGVRFAAVAGLVSSVFQAAPMLHNSNAGGTPFIWLLVSGLAYLGAVAWFEVCCPGLLKQAIARRSNTDGQHGRRWLRALVDDELRRWWVKREWLPRPEQLDLSKMEDRTIVGIMSGYGTPAFAGFGVYARAHIELALDEFAKAQNIRLWRCGGIRGNGLSEFEPTHGYEGQRPWVERLSIRNPESMELERYETSKRDLVVEWSRVPVDISERLPKRRHIEISREVEGLHHLFETDAQATAFTQIIAHWQDTMRPWRRMFLLTLYATSFSCFAAFVFAQINSTLHVIPAAPAAIRQNDTPLKGRTVKIEMHAM